MLPVHVKNRRGRVNRVPRPRPPRGFALIRLLCGGICNTDLELQRGYYGFTGVPGHEFVGEVVEAGRRELIGRRVVGEINLCCGGGGRWRPGPRPPCPKRTGLGLFKQPRAVPRFFPPPHPDLHLGAPSLPPPGTVFI